MTSVELLQIGDKVVFNVDPEYRAWTNDYQDVPDGTEGVVCGFYDAVIYESRIPVFTHHPGVYHRRGAASVWLSDGRIVPGGWSIEMVDKDEEKRRDIALRDADGVRHTEQVRLGDLPDTKFWEQDRVCVRFPNSEWGEQKMIISHIDYYYMHSCRCDGSPFPFYGVRFMKGGQTSAEELWIELIERGNVWKYYNNQPLSFADLKEEADFFRLVGQTREVRNPKNDRYSWTKDEVLAAIRDGAVHGFSLLGSGPYLSAWRFNDELLGKRVAETTLEGFSIA